MSRRSLRFRMTMWYAGLLAGALVLFGVSVYVGLARYLDWNLEKSLQEQCRSIGLNLLPEVPKQPAGFLTEEIEESFAPEVNGHFFRVTRGDGTVIYRSGNPKSGKFDPANIPAFPADQAFSRKIRIPHGRRLLLTGMVFTNPDGTRFLVESGVPYRQVEEVLQGLLLTLVIYVPFLVLLAITGGYWLMRRSLKPVDEITQQAEGITSSNLSQRLPVIKSGDELERLSVALNRMIARLDDAFQHANRFSADASHELRTPLTILQLELEGMAQNRQLAPELLDQVGSALEETQRLSHIVENLLTIARLDAGEARMEKVNVNLGELAAETSEQMKLLAEEKSVSLHCQAAAGVFVEGDRSRLKQVIVNLIDNAIKYTPARREVTVKVWQNGNGAVLEVADTGAGIPAEALPHIFERFYRADKARSRESGGAGLGLAIVKAICAAHDAEISVSSTEGQGARFTVSFPVAKIDPSAA
ncbi:MAG TPA: heavy metal sensor histidine kinase, partial [Terriglobales bacterium]|nr:heavy metal sensor histidine kinase [Terriglobales bacterium]